MGEEFYQLRYNAVQLLKVCEHFGGIYHLRFQGRKINRARYQCESKYQIAAGVLLSIFFDPEDRSDISSEMSVEFQWTAWRYIPEDSNSHNHLCENLKFYNTIRYFPTG
jgi:hypothetical protein